jgi:imidazolonepropionase-like amidohydrolase
LVPKAEYETLQSPETVHRIEAKRSNSASTKAHLPIVRGNLKKVYDAGIPVVTGTDTGLYGVVVGVSSHLELVLHVEAGIAPTDVLRLATVNAARMVGREKDLGSIEAGKLADLVILDADPLADIGNTRYVVRVIRGGAVYAPAQLMSLVDLKHNEIEQRLQSTPSSTNERTGN